MTADVRVPRASVQKSHPRLHELIFTGQWEIDSDMLWVSVELMKALGCQPLSSEFLRHHGLGQLSGRVYQFLDWYFFEDNGHAVLIVPWGSQRSHHRWISTTGHWRGPVTLLTTLRMLHRASR